MNRKVKEKWDTAAFELAKQIKKDDKPYPYSYMVLSAATIIEIFYSAVYSVKEDDFPFSTKTQYEKKLKEIKPHQMKSLFVFFLLDYFAFLKFEMHPKFFETFPLSYEELLNGFKEAFKGYPSELALLEQTINEFEKPYHSRTFLQRTGLPKQQEDAFLVHTLNELKSELFHQFNKNIARIVNLSKRKAGGNNV
ncbi:hypothetical protein [Priestia megaterium]|uniref:Uncharacterized protein n=1 Tax=Priestia megaterium TaxID=1404 RepID=A0A6M6E8X1_PRIMG|nr:hypothetical protein [Priestia megaterium]QJX80868.1 hypothetical protein FDZ14_32785 [Priestia megaterium]